MKLSIKSISNIVDNVTFKQLAGPRDVDLCPEGLDGNPVMVALNRSTDPSSNAHVMSSQELEHYLVDMLGIQRNYTCSNSSSLGGDVRPYMETTTLTPEKWNFVGKTQLRPFSNEERYAGNGEHRPEATPHAGLYSSGAVGLKNLFDVSSKLERGHSYLSNRVGVPKPLFKNQKRGGKYCNGYQYKNGTIAYRSLKNPPKYSQNRVLSDPANTMSMEDFIEVLSQVKLEGPEIGRSKSKHSECMIKLNNENQALRASVR